MNTDTIQQNAEMLRSTRAKLRAVNLVKTITMALGSPTCPPRFNREVRSVLLALGNAHATPADAASLVTQTWARYKTKNVSAFLSHFEDALTLHPTEFELYLDLNGSLVPDEEAGNLIWKALRFADGQTAARLHSRFQAIVERNAR